MADKCWALVAGAVLLLSASPARAQSHDAAEAAQPPPAGAAPAAPAVIPPPAPPPWQDQPLSTSGTETAPPPGAFGPPPGPGRGMGPGREGGRWRPGRAGGPETDAARIRRLERVVGRLLREREAEHRGPMAWLHHLELTAFVQPQLVYRLYNAAASPNATGGILPDGIGANDTMARPDGTTTNTDYFRLRRARFALAFTPNRFARFVIGVEPIPLLGGPFDGTGTPAREVQAIAIAPLPRGARLEFGAGMFEPFVSQEVLEYDPDRPFIEHSFMEQNLFPEEFDTGVHANLYTRRDRLQVALSLVNGKMLGEPGFTVVPDLNKGKDGVLRVLYDFGPADVALSGWAGQGETVDAQKLRFKNYPRWLLDLDATVHHRFFKKLGASRAYFTVAYGSNMDRGIFYSFGRPVIPADINADVIDKPELGGVVRLEQDFTRWATLALRYDYYSPDVSLENNGRHTLGVVAAAHYTRALQLDLEFDQAFDTARASGAAGEAKLVSTFSAVLQGRL